VTRIALDAMGGDAAPSAPVAGAIEALDTLPPSCEVILVGRSEQIAAAIDDLCMERPERLSILDAPEVIEMSEKPLAAVRGKRKSSIRIGLETQKAGGADALVSAGNTGAMMAASALILGLHPGVERAAIGALFPTASKPVLVLDAGANIDCGPRKLRGFAHIGNVYAKDVLRRDNPKVGLLNIGEEEEKGNQAVRQAFDLLQSDSGINFIGNVEGGDILTGELDVVVCDGFVGNVLLKFYESVARLFVGLLRQEMEQDVLESEAMGRVLKVLDYSEYGGAPLLGVRGVSIICHGRSSARAFKNAIGVALQAVESHVSQHIGDEMASGASR